MLFGRRRRPGILNQVVAAPRSGHFAGLPVGQARSRSWSPGTHSRRGKDQPGGGLRPRAGTDPSGLRAAGSVAFARASTSRSGSGRRAGPDSLRKQNRVRHSGGCEPGRCALAHLRYRRGTRGGRATRPFARAGGRRIREPGEHRRRRDGDVGGQYGTTEPNSGWHSNRSMPTRRFGSSTFVLSSAASRSA